MGEAKKEWKNHHTHCTDGKSLQPSSLPHPRGVNYTDRCTIWDVVQISYFLYIFLFFFFLRKRDAKTTLALPCLVLGSQCWLWDGSSQNCWHVGSDPDQLRGCPRRCSLHSGTWGRGSARAGSVCAHLASVGTKHHWHCCQCWVDHTPAPEWEQLFGYLLDCQEQEGGGG